MDLEILSTIFSGTTSAGMVAFLAWYLISNTRSGSAKLAETAVSAAGGALKMKSAEAAECEAKIKNMGVRLDAVLTESATRDLDHTRKIAALLDKTSTLEKSVENEQEQRKVSDKKVEELEKKLDEETQKRRALEDKVKKLEEENAALKRENAELKARMTDYEKPAVSDKKEEAA